MLLYIIISWDDFKHAGCPRTLRADRGTENSIIAFLQPSFRHFHLDSMSGAKSFLYGRSTTNQVHLKGSVTEWYN